MGKPLSQMGSSNEKQWQLFEQTATKVDLKELIHGDAVPYDTLRPIAVLIFETFSSIETWGKLFDLTGMPPAAKMAYRM